jgi:uncharacterized membrane protein
MIAGETYMWVFRTVHILGGLIWVGSVFMLVVYLQPAAAAIAPAGTPMMAELLGKRRLVDGILLAATLTILAGAAVYWHDWHLYADFNTWVNTGFGGTLTFGALCAILAWLFGIFVTRPSVNRLMALGREVAASGAAPSPEVVTQIADIQRRLKVVARGSLVLLVIAVGAMASARYV